MNKRQKVAIIIGAGPAGLTAAHELLTKTDIKPIILEASNLVGGLSKTIDYKGNKIDIGGHRFFSKSQKILEWWTSILKLEKHQVQEINYKGQKSKLLTSKVVRKGQLLVSPRKSRIFFEGKLFDYPLKIESLINLGYGKLFKIGWSYCGSVIFPRKPEKNLEDFFINRFGMELYANFFKSYSEKVWGMKCKNISNEWGSQRVKSLSIKEVVIDMIICNIPYLNKWWKDKKPVSLTEFFLYPRLGPGQMWQEVARKVKEMGGEIKMEYCVDKITRNNNRILEVNANGEIFRGDYFFSTMPINDLIKSMGRKVPVKIKSIANKLEYREFIVVGMLLSNIKLKEKDGSEIKDNWIYVHNNKVKVGRIQLFHNWSIDLVKDKNYKWIGMEYWCKENDSFWNKSESQLAKLAKDELIQLGISEKDSVVDSIVVKVKKAYPVYSGGYKNMEELKKWINKISNLYLIGRNGMHRYNNQDHSMMVAMKAVDLIVSKSNNKDELWKVNTDEVYAE